MKNQNRIRRNAATKPAKSQVKISAEFKVVRLRECPVDSPQIETPKEVADFWRKQVVTAPWFKDDKECICVFLLNTRCRLLGFELLSLGTLDTVSIHPRDVFRLASIRSAAKIIVAHNHPSGDPVPSEADIKVTLNLIQLGEQLGIKLIDHVIIGDARREHGHASLKALGYFDREELPTENKTRKNSRDVRGAAEEVNTAVAQSNVLLELIEVHLEHREHRSGEDFTGERADTFNFGLAMLANNTRERLKKAAAAIMDAAYAKNVEVVS